MVEKNESKTKVTVVFEQEMDNQLEATMQEIFEILNLALKFDIRDNPNGGTYSLVYAAYLKQGKTMEFLRPRRKKFLQDVSQGRFLSCVLSPSWTI